MENLSYYTTADAFGPARPQMIGGTRLEPVLAETGAFLQENGDVVFRFHEPAAKDITLVFISGRGRQVASMERDEEGFFTYTLSHAEHPEIKGKRGVNILVDGIPAFSQRIPAIFRGNKMSNYFEIPAGDWDDYLLKDVPHGSLSYEIYWSSVLGNWQRCMVYTPAEYQKHPERSYPVMYLHHGWGENETSWMFGGKVPFIMDNLIAEGRARPFLVVTNENMAKLPSDGTHGMAGYTEILLKDCIPFIEEKYRVLSDKWHRGIGGNSYGCMITSLIGFGHPELFGNLGLFSGGLRCKDFWPSYEENHHLDWLYDNADEVARQYRLIYRAHGTIEYHDSPDHVQDDEFLQKNGITELPNFVREFFPDGRHEWDTFGRDFAGFAQRAFRDD